MTANSCCGSYGPLRQRKLPFCAIFFEKEGGHIEFFVIFVAENATFNTQLYENPYLSARHGYRLRPDSQCTNTQGMGRRQRHQPQPPARTYAGHPCSIGHRSRCCLHPHQRPGGLTLLPQPQRQLEIPMGWHARQSQQHLLPRSVRRLGMGRD